MASILRTQARGFASLSSLPPKTPVIVSAARTPIGSFQGALSSLTATQLGTIAVKGAVERSGIDVKEFNEVIFGNVVGAGLGQAVASQIAVRAGVPNTVPTTVVNKVCASGMKTVMFGAQSILLGHNNVVLAGGTESMSNVPYYLEKGRTGLGYGHAQLVDGILKDGLMDAFDNHHMGMCAEKCASDHGFSRQDQDKYAVETYKLAVDATKNGRFRDEIVPVTVSSKKGDVVVTEDEQFKKFNIEKMPSLKPAFKKDGTVTAANASALNDGAAALVLVSAEFAQKNGLQALGYIRGFADAQQAPIDFTTAPSKAMPLAFQRAGVTLKDIDFIEINEAFSVVSLANVKILGLDRSRVNVNGGAVALGHPIGCSGARIIVTLLNVLKQRNGTLGVASICNGGGGASAVVVERL